MYRWCSYVTRFALPVYGENGEIERYNVFCAIMLVRHAEDNKLYLYDIMKIKKETSTHLRSKDLTQPKTRFLEMKRAARLSHMAVHDTKPISWIHIIRLW